MLARELERQENNIVGRVRSTLEELAVGAGTVTFQGLNDRIMNCLSQAGLPALVERMDSLINAPPAVASPVTSTVPLDAPTLCYWGGAYRRVLQDFNFPESGAFDMWFLWNCGDNARNIGPYKSFETMDMPNPNAKKRLSDLKFFANILVDKARELGIYENSMSEARATEVYNLCQESVGISTITRRN